MKKLVCLLALAMLTMLLVAGCGEKKEIEGITEINGTSGGLTSTMTMLANYEGMKVSAKDIEPTQDDINYQRDVVQMTILQEVEGKTVVENGDIVNMDYQGFLDGVAFETGTAKGFDVEIGSETLIEGFEEGLVGAELGGFYSLDLKFPDDYADPEFAGKPVVFEVTINKIQEIVKADDAYIQEYLRDYNLKKLMLDTLIAESQFNLDPAELEKWENNIMDQYEYSASLGGGMEDMLAFFGMTMEDLEETVREEAAYSIKGYLVIDEIARLEGLANEEELLEGYTADGTFVEIAVLNCLAQKAVVK